MGKKGSILNGMRRFEAKKKNKKKSWIGQVTDPTLFTVRIVKAFSAKKHQ